VSEGLLDDDSGVRREVGVVETLDHGREQERWDLEVEHRQRCAGDRGRHALVGGVVGEVALYVRQPRGQAVEHVVVE
jgi:hypothetical protein